MIKLQTKDIERYGEN